MESKSEIAKRHRLDKSEMILKMIRTPVKKRFSCFGKLQFCKNMKPLTRQNWSSFSLVRKEAQFHMHCGIRSGNENAIPNSCDCKNWHMVLTITLTTTKKKVNGVLCGESHLQYRQLTLQSPRRKVHPDKMHTLEPTEQYVYDNIPALPAILTTSENLTTQENDSSGSGLPPIPLHLRRCYFMNYL